INEFGDNNASRCATGQFPGHVARVVSYGAHGTATEESTPAFGAGGLLALFGVCVHPPIEDPGTKSSGSGGTIHKGGGGGGGTAIGGEGGGGGTIASASSSPEPTGLVIGTVGAGLAALAEFLRKRLPPQLV